MARWFLAIPLAVFLSYFWFEDRSEDDELLFWTSTSSSYVDDSAESCDAAYGVLADWTLPSRFSSLSIAGDRMAVGDGNYNAKVFSVDRRRRSR